MATAAAHTQSPNMILRPIEGNSKWVTGPITYNIVTLDNAAELAAFNALRPDATPTSPQMDMDMDLQPVWAIELAQAFTVYEEIVNIDLELNNDINADFLIGQDNNVTSLGFSDGPRNPDPGESNLLQAYNITDPSATTNAETGGGSDRFYTILHEVAHSIGLAHPHSADDGSSTTGAPEEMQPAPYQAHQTVVSYTAPPDVPAPGLPGAHMFGWSVTPMALDIAALHNMYGANMTTRTGNSTYTLTDAMTAALDNTGDTISVGRAYYGIWDAGTNDVDTIQYGGGARVLINLNAATLTNTPGADITNIIAQLQTTTAWGTLSAQTQGEITNNTGTAAGFFSSVLAANGDRIQGGFSIANGVTIENAIGSTGNDVFVGNTANNVMLGNSGDDTLLGGSGNDILNGGSDADDMRGGSGNDNYIVDRQADMVTELAGEGTDLVRAATSYTLGANVENGELLGTIAYNLVGNSLNNALTGNSASNIMLGGGGNDAINGRGGADDMRGGTGNDNYVVDNAGDTITEGAGGGTDLIRTAVSYTVSNNVENGIMLGNGDIFLAGNGLDNTLVGNDGVNTLNGRAGADRMFGNGGNDTYVVDNVGDVIGEVAANGIDTVLAVVSRGTLEANVERLTMIGTGNINGSGNESANVVLGNSGNNVINGRGGNDTILAGLGLDTQYGGSGSDTFVFNSVLESGPSSAERDRIADFATGDRIYLASIDANETVAGNQAFALDTNGSFSAGEIQQTQFGANLLLQMNTDADAAAEMSILLFNTGPLDAGDFVF